MAERVFVDSNLWLYAAMEEEDGDEKCAIAKQIIEQNDVIISIQVINEVSFNLLRKYDYTEQEVVAFIHQMTASCPLSRLDIQTCLDASSLRQGYRLSFWDSLIVSSALEAGCAMLYSEDMQHGLRIRDMQIINPFLSIVNH